VKYLYLAIAIVVEVGATSALKASDALPHPMFPAIVLIA
jgi:multidrug transporter EmrE-like cation transporter